MALAQATIGYNTPAGGGGSITICDAAVTTDPLTAAAVKSLLDTLPAVGHVDRPLALKKQQELADFIGLQQNVQGANSTGIPVVVMGRNRVSTRVGVTVASRDPITRVVVFDVN